jgi:cbb3-type cytochrome oxidase maturation protein
MVALIFLVLFIWTVKSGQYDDTDSPAVRILFDDRPREKKGEDEKDGKIKKPPE